MSSSSAAVADPPAPPAVAADGDTYTRAFFDQQRGESGRSAHEVVPVVMELARPRSVIDVGCGVGAWLAAFAERGASRIFGIDGDYVDRNLLLVPPAAFQARDLSRPFGNAEDVAAFGGPFDLAVSLEVAEHLPPASADEFVAGLTRLSPAVLFSAAVPGQGGVNHLNEQWPDYWAARFEARGYAAIDCLRWRVWDNQRVAWYYAQNALFYVRRDALDRYPVLARELAAQGPHPLSVVHPRMYQGLIYHTDPRTISLRAATRLFGSVLKNAVRRRIGAAAK